jgi:hypothetical protein
MEPKAQQTEKQHLTQANRKTNNGTFKSKNISKANSD